MTGLARLLCATVSLAGLADDSEDREAIHDQLRPALVAFADWCQSNRLYRTRNQLARALLHFDPQHETSMKWLGYKKRGGEWLPPQRPPNARDRSKQALAELPAQRQRWLAPWDQELRELVERRDLDPEVRFRVIGDLVALNPEDEATRELAGEVRDGDAWILRESLAARERRQELNLLGDQSVLDVADPEPDELTDVERGAAIAWQPGFRTTHVRVQGTEPSDRLEEAARVLEACVSFYMEELAPKPWAPRHTAYLVHNIEEGKAILRALGADDARIRSVEGTGGQLWIEKGLAVNWFTSSARLRDAASRDIVRWMMYRDYLALAPWVMEGVGLFACQKLTTTTMTWYFRRDRYDETVPSKDLQSRLFEEDADWLAECRALVAEGRHPVVHQIMTAHLNVMGPVEYVFAFALAAYWIEGRPDDVAPLLRRLGNRDPAEVVPTATGMSIRELDARFYRWLEETAPR